MGHAVRAARIASASVLLPLSRFDELLIGAGVSIAHEIAWPLPTENRVTRDTPGGAIEVDLSLEKIEEERRMIEPPLLTFPTGEGVAEDLSRYLDAQKMLLVGSFLVGIAGRDLHRVHAELVVEVVEDGLDRLGVV